MQSISECPEWLVVELFGEPGGKHGRSVNRAPEGNSDVFCTISWAGHDIDIPLNKYEQFIIDALAAGVAQGSRNQTGFCIGMTLLDMGLSHHDMDLSLRSWNQRNTPGPLGDKEITKLSLSVVKHWSAKQQHKKNQHEWKENRTRGIEELSSFLGVEIKDVYQTPDEDKTITIIAQQNGTVAQSVHKVVAGYRAWASDFAKQTLIVPFLPDKITNQFSNDFLRLLLGCARVAEIPEASTKEGQVKEAIDLIIDSGKVAPSREEAGIMLDGRGREYFQSFFEDGKLFFHYSDLKKHLLALTNDPILDREINKILNSLGFCQRKIKIHEKRAKAWSKK